MNINLAGLQSHSGLSGLLELGTVSATPITISGLTIPSNSASSIYQMPLQFKSNQVISLININVSGLASGISNYWFPLVGSLQLYDATLSMPMYFICTSATNGRLIQFQMGNNLAGAPITVPTITVNATAYMYKYPF